MNERIQELNQQALSEVLNGPDPDRDINRMYIPAEFTKKFAELIVADCLKEIKDMLVDESELLYPNNKQTTQCVNDRLLDAYDNIAEHFGVES